MESIVAAVSKLCFNRHAERGFHSGSAVALGGGAPQQGGRSNCRFSSTKIVNCYRPYVLNHLPVSSTSTRAVIVIEGRLLVVRLSATYCFLPGGRLERGETLLDCLSRELREEVGNFNWQIGPYLGKIDHTWALKTGDGKTRAVQHFFVANAADLTCETTPKHCHMDNIDFEWLSLGQLQSAALKPPSLAPRVYDWVNRRAKGWSIVDVEE